MSSLVPEILWINHASYALTYGATCLVVDPWLDGAAFNHGWSLLAASRFRAEDFARVTHIWISHEHPDHFSPPTLLKIPEQFRRQIVLLYRRTRDGRVAAFCRRAGFRVMEVDSNHKYTIGDSFTVTCGTVGSDSWLATQCGDRAILNVNDCVFRSADDVRALQAVVGSPDVVLTQFSYANWTGNPGDSAAMQAAAREKIEEMTRQIDVLQPRWVIPFASYILFSHEENAYLNEHANRVDDAVAVIRKTQKLPVVLYPGDVWAIGATHDPAPAIAHYKTDRLATTTRALAQAVSVPFEDLQLASEAFVVRMRKRNWLWMFRPLRWLRLLRPVHIYVRDLNRTVRVEIFAKMAVHPLGRAGPDIEMSADSLLFMLKNDFGIDTLLINGRFRELKRGARAMLSRQFAIARHNNDGFSYPRRLLDFAYVRRKLRQAMASVNPGATRRRSE